MVFFKCLKRRQTNLKPFQKTFFNFFIYPFKKGRVMQIEDTNTKEQ